ncbi:MAG TPA: MFS transporter [Dermatophilaceae bacterium]|nr:MFS transporter [Dermatophilaceae bacterium]
MTTPAPAPGRSALVRVVAARNAVLVVFALAGVAFAAWASRIADAKAALGMTAGELGITLFAASGGSLLAMPSTGRIVRRFGVTRSIGVGVAVGAAGLVIAGAGVDLAASRVLLAAGLFLTGLGIGVWDVSMNLEGATVERHLGRNVMPHFHAAFSGGTVVSALVGAGLSWAQVPVVAHLAGVMVLVLLGMGWALPRFLPDDEGAGNVADARGAVDGSGAAAGRRPRSAWRERRTLLIGLVVFVAAFTEGTANDWLAVGFVEGHDLPAWAGVLAFATFLAFMTLGRLVGTRLLDRHGRVPVLRVTFAAAAAGSLLVVFGSGWLAYVGAAVWGLGVSLGFPVGMSASADDPERAAARMPVVATLGYTAFIAGPPALGFLGDHYGVLHSLLAVGAMVALVLLALPAVREPAAAREAARARAGAR